MGSISSLSFINHFQQANNRPMKTQIKTNYISELNNILIQKRAVNPKYSTRALARDIEMDAGDLSNILKGKKRVTPKLAYKIGLHLGLEGANLLSFILPALKENEDQEWP
jgi:hypothetical protein